MSEVKLCECGCGQPVKNRFAKEHYQMVSKCESPWSKLRIEEMRVSGWLIEEMREDALRLTGKRPTAKMVHRWIKQSGILWRPIGETLKIKHSKDKEFSERIRAVSKSNMKKVIGTLTTEQRKQNSSTEKFKVALRKVQKGKIIKHQIVRQCAWCNKTIVRYQSGFKNAASYCSHSCAARSRSSRITQPFSTINPLSLKKQRKLKGLTQQALADMIGVSASSIHLYEAHKVSPGDDVADKLIAILGDSIRPKLYEPPAWANQLTTQGGPDGSNEAAGAREKR